ncbi:GTP-binding protein Rho1 [Entomortierella beljakovae]|nr:GTP-binding protein Rho1 [Entomortierella beljakovae]
MSSTAAPLRRKITFVGENNSGKTSLIFALSRGIFPEIIPAIFDTFSAQVTVDGVPLDIELWDGEAMAKRLDATYFECSAKTMDGIDDLLNLSAVISLTLPKKETLLNKYIGVLALSDMTEKIDEVVDEQMNAVKSFGTASLACQTSPDRQP